MPWMYGGGYEFGGWSSPSFSYSPPSFSYSPPSFSYSSPVFSPPSYDSFFSTPSMPVFDYSIPSTTMPSWYSPYQSTYLSNPAPLFQNDPVSQYLIDSSRITMGDPYGLIYGDPNAYNTAQSSYLDTIPYVYSPSYAAGVAAGLGGASAGSYADYMDRGGSLDPYSFASSMSSIGDEYALYDFGLPSSMGVPFGGIGNEYAMYDFGLPSSAGMASSLGLPFGGIGDEYAFYDFGTGNFYDPSASPAPAMSVSDFYNPEPAPANTATAYDFSAPDAGIMGLPSAQLALAPSGIMSDVGESPLQTAMSRSLNVEGGAAPAPMSSSGAGLQLNSNGSSTVTTASGQQINLDDADTRALIEGRTTLAELAAKGESSTRLSPTTVAADQGLSLAQSSPVRDYSGSPTIIPPSNAPWMPRADNPNLEGKIVIGPDGVPREVAYTAADIRKTPELRQAQEMDAYERMLRGQGPEPITGIGAQQMQITPENMASFQRNLQDIFNNRGGYTSQWQTVGNDRIMVQDDGTGVGINTETGESYSLTRQDVNRLIDGKVLNTAQSGYVAATGGTGNRPGGSPAAKAQPRSRAQAQSGRGGGGGGGGGSAPQRQQQQQQRNNAKLAALLAAMALMNKGDKADGMSAAELALMRQRADADMAGRRAGSNVVQHYTDTALTRRAEGGMTTDDYAGGGIASLGSYSDGGRLLKGPGDGVSDSIPATIGNQRKPARLADGEFVVPARIVSELGNGSTEAGARKLYAMMERVQRDRRKSVGKNKVAVNSRADKHLPA